MSILIAGGENGLVSLSSALDGTAKPITLCFFAKVDSFPTSSSTGVMPVKTSGGSGYLAARIFQNSSTVRQMLATANDGSNSSAAYDLTSNFAGQWRGCVSVFTSNTLRDVYTRINGDSGGLLTASNTTSKVTSGETGIELLSGAWPTSAARYSHLTVYDQALTSTQADEFLLSGSVAGITPLHRWAATSDWGAGTVADTGSSPIPVTPPVTWTYSPDNPNFAIGPNTAPEVSSTKLYTFQYQINATDADGDTLTYSILTQGSHGVASVNSSGLVTYTPGGSFAGSDSFVVQVSDGNGGIVNSTINISGGIPAVDPDIISITFRGLTAVRLTASSFTARGL